LSLISFQMMRVISSPSMSTTGLATLIFSIGDLRQLLTIGAGARVGSL
jgi:sulfite exporter TauE/SafE